MVHARVDRCWNCYSVHSSFWKSSRGNALRWLYKPGSPVPVVSATLWGVGAQDHSCTCLYIAGTFVHSLDSGDPRDRNSIRDCRVISGIISSPKPTSLSRSFQLSSYAEWGRPRV